MSEQMPDDLDLITITQLRQVANQTPQPYRLHLQVESRIEKATSSGSPFYEVKLVDAGDSFVWRVFDNHPLFQDAAKLTRNTFIQLAGQWVEGKYGLEPRQVQMRALAEDESSTLLLGDPDLAARQQADYADIVAFIESIRDPRLLKLCSAFLERHGERFRRTGAARRNHHARRGGLVEHVAQMMRCAMAIAGVYPTLNRDLMIAGVLFHDCGKLWENAYAESGFTMPYNLTAEMLGHIPLGLELVNKMWRDMLDTAAAAPKPCVCTCCTSSPRITARTSSAPPCCRRRRRPSRCITSIISTPSSKCSAVPTRPAKNSPPALLKNSCPGR
jgi:3'-5' exoribonuclease